MGESPHQSRQLMPNHGLAVQCVPGIEDKSGGVFMRFPGVLPRKRGISLAPGLLSRKMFLKLCWENMGMVLCKECYRCLEVCIAGVIKGKKGLNSGWYCTKCKVFVRVWK